MPDPTRLPRQRHRGTLPMKLSHRGGSAKIHIRAHTGDKPFICKEPSCGQRFSQQGNLKTHQRRHTGEKPFQCDICHKPFAQRGNLRAHRLTHDQSKRFDCRLDECGKQFTQLGNLKSHQNKFHAATLHNLTIRFSQMAENGPMNMNAADRDLWIYFAGLYKNSNKGIKGRGKDRRISMTRRSDPKRRFEDAVADADAPWEL
ncbi:transcriptional regulator family: C2H2 zinc finger [Penicillium roqueforti]|nr:transcriptional regulator family: C2H2 zinc finger [Penicillium roqueforti]